MKKVDIDIGSRYAVGHAPDVKLGFRGHCHEVTGFSDPETDHPAHVKTKRIDPETGDDWISGHPIRRDQGNRFTIPYNEIAIPWDDYALRAAEREARLEDRERTTSERRDLAVELMVIFKANGIEGVVFGHPFDIAEVPIDSMSKIARLLEDPPSR